MPATLMSDRPNEYEVYFSRIMLDHAIDEVHLADYAQLRPLPKNNGNNQIRFFRIPVASAANVQAVTEGTLVTQARKLVFEFVTINLSQYYDWIQVSDLLNDTEFNDTGEAASTTFGEECALWYDQQLRNVCCLATGGLTKRYANNATNTTFATLSADATAAANMKVAYLLDAVTLLRINKAPKIKGTYSAIVAPQVMSDLVKENSTAWINMDAFANRGKGILSGWIGNLYGVNIVMTTNPFQETSGGTEGTAVAGGGIFSTQVIGKDAFGSSALQGNTPWSPKVQVNGKPDKYDVIGQFVNFSWKVYAGFAILNPAFGVNLRTKSAWA